MDSNYNNLEIARVGYFYVERTKYEVYINTDDSESTPHFHINKADYGEGFHTSISLEKAEYLFHEGIQKENCPEQGFQNEDKKDTLNRDEIRLLIRFLRQHYMFGISNWKNTLILWNKNNSLKVDKNSILPNYMKLL